MKIKIDLPDENYCDSCPLLDIDKPDEDFPGETISYCLLWLPERFMVLKKKIDGVRKHFRLWACIEREHKLIKETKL